VGRIVSLPEYRAQRGGTYRFEFIVDSWLTNDGAAPPEPIGATKLRLSFSPLKTSVTESQQTRIPAYGQCWEFHVRLK
jgi:hypothetical protein